MKCRNKERADEDKAVQAEALRQWIEMQKRDLGNPWPPESIEEINLLGDGGSNFAVASRIGILVQFALRSLPVLGPEDMRPVSIPSLPFAQEIKPEPLARLRRELGRILDGIEIGVRINLMPIVNLRPGEEPIASLLPVPLPPRPRPLFSVVLPGDVA